jgi:hypothetical protein
MTDETPPGGTADRQEELLRQIANLATSVEHLAQRTSTRGVVLQDGEQEPPKPTPEQEKERFAYRFLGHLIGSRGSAFQFDPVDVFRFKDPGDGLEKLEFSGLAEVKGTAALLRARDGARSLLKPIADDTPIREPERTIGKPIDTIVVFGDPAIFGDALVPVAIGCVTIPQAG